MLGHLSTPDENEGYQLAALGQRLNLSAHVPLGSNSPDQLAAVLAELESDGLAHDNGSGIWQMTPEGLEAITAEATEEAIARGAEGPVEIGQPTPLAPEEEK